MNDFNCISFELTGPSLQGIETDLFRFADYADEFVLSIDQRLPAADDTHLARIDNFRVERRTGNVPAVPQDPHVEHAHLLRRVVHSEQSDVLLDDVRLADAVRSVDLHAGLAHQTSGVDVKLRQRSLHAVQQSLAVSFGQSLFLHNENER